MKSGLYFSQAFSSAISKTYKLETLHLLPNQLFPIYRSKWVNRKNVFSLPFNFYQTAEFYSSHGFCERYWHRLSSVVVDKGLSYSIASVGELGLNNGVHIADNPVLALSQADEVFSCFSKNHRQNVRKERNKAKSLGVHVRRISALRDLKIFYHMMSRQYVKYHQMLFQPYSLFERLFVAGLADVFLACCGDNPCGGLFCLRDGPIYHYNWGVRLPYANVNSGTLLIDFAIRHACAKGFSYFDFGSTPLSDRELLLYKLKWGSASLPVFKYYAGTVQREVDLNSSYPFARKLFSLTPPAAARALMPFVVPLVVR